MTKSKSSIYWAIAIILSLAFGAYQRMTGPTYPIKGSVEIANQEIKYTLPRTHEGSDNEIVNIVAPQNIKGYYTYKRFPSYDSLTKADLVRVNDTLKASLPGQPPAGKLEYKIFLHNENPLAKDLTNETVKIRFKGYTPRWIIILHVIFIFLGLIFSVRVFFEALLKGANIQKQMNWAIITTIVGGFVFGPIMQYYAFGAFWTGFPFGWDLTDNKTLIGLIAWLIALWRFKKNPSNPYPVIIASIIFVVVFLIPHSVLGSEINHTKAP